MQKLADLPHFQEMQNIILEGFDPVAAGGFTQVPNFLLNKFDLSFAAKVVYAKLLSYAWHNNRVFPGQETMAAEIGSKKSTINKAIKELEDRGWLEIFRRGQGKTNVYTLKHTVKDKRK
jgi:predicted transcriptional regulator